MMVVEDSLMGEDDFPVGMRVLAVDDDQTCLKLLESMLRKCKYHVTTTTESVKALEMLRENRNKFDLVISDVNMPDMDGFKFLKQVGLEMDLPVIMLSGNGDKERVMKGVINGACDYLMKPIRIEELQNIWQHVVRKKVDGKDQRKVTITNNEEKISNMAVVCSQDNTSENTDDKNKMLGEKRKERSEEEEAEEDDDGDNEDEDEESDEKRSTRKKPRFVWDNDLHRKFVAAVNQLGLDNAFPKKILDLMNVEGLTRENVASHLQKYRLSLKRPTKQARIDATLDTTNPYLQMGSVGVYGDLCTLSGSRRILSSTLPSYTSSEIIFRQNEPSGLNFRGIRSSGRVPLLQSQNINSFKLPSFSANKSSSFLQRIRTSTALNQFQPNKYPTSNMKLSSIGGPSPITSSFSFQDIRTTINNANNSLSCISSNSLLTHNLGAFINHSSVGSSPAKAESFNPVTVSGSSNSLDYNRINKSWQNSAQLSNFASNSFPLIPLSEDFNNNQMSRDSLKFVSISSNFRSPIDFSSTRVVAVPSEEAMHCQDGLLENVVKPSSYTAHQIKSSSTFNNNLDSLASPNGKACYMVDSLAQTNSPSITQMPEVEKFYSDAKIMESNGDCFFQQMISLEGFIQNSSVSLDDMISETAKQDHH